MQFCNRTETLIIFIRFFYNLSLDQVYLEHFKVRPFKNIILKYHSFLYFLYKPPLQSSTEEYFSFLPVYLETSSPSPKEIPASSVSTNFMASEGKPIPPWFWRWTFCLLVVSFKNKYKFTQNSVITSKIVKYNWDWLLGAM